MDAIPTRKLDIHLHRQVLKNDHYKPKESDLEDWAGLGAAACYADAVVCEKHFASLLARDGFTHHARIETNLSETFKSLGRNRSSAQAWESTGYEGKKR